VRDVDVPIHSLVALEQALVQAHATIVAAEISALAEAMDAGDALTEIKRRKLIRHGQWEDFYSRTVGSKQTASVYITLAEHRALIEAANVQRAGRLTIREALKLISKRQNPRTPRPKSPLNLSAWSDEELTTALAELGIDRFLRVMPDEWRPKIQARAGGQMIAREKTKHPNTRLKNLRLVQDANSPTPATH
jgi:hypothetical protein